MILVIAEKPSVAQTIAAVLGAKEKKDGFLTGSGYIVSWCVGHLVGLAEAAAYGEQYKKWSYDSLPILPQEWKYTVSADKEKQFKTLKELMHRADVSEVVNACDAGREGELIFRFVYEMAGCFRIMQGKSRLANRYQCHPPFFCPLQSYLERGARTDPDLKNAC